MPISTPPPCQPGGAGSSGHAPPAAGCRPGRSGAPPVVQLPAPVGLGTVLQNPGQPFFGRALLDPVHCAQGHIQSFSHLGSRPTVVALEENPGPGGDSGRAIPNPNQTPEFFPQFHRQPHRILVPDHHCHPRQQHFPPGRMGQLSGFLNKC